MLKIGCNLLQVFFFNGCHGEILLGKVNKMKMVSEGVWREKTENTRLKRFETGAENTRGTTQIAIKSPLLESDNSYALTRQSREASTWLTAVRASGSEGMGNWEMGSSVHTNHRLSGNLLSVPSSSQPLPYYNIDKNGCQPLF